MGEVELLEEMAAQVDNIKYQTDLYMLYSGMYDPVSGDVTPDPRDVSKNNVQPKDAMTHIFYAYRYALQFTALARLYDRNGYNLQKEKITYYRRIAKKVITHFEEPLFRWLTDLPNEIKE